MGIIRYFLPTAGINGINLCIAGIKEYFLYYFVLYIAPKNFNALKNVLCIKKSVASQVITFNNNVMNLKKSLVIATLSISFSQVINKTYDAGSQSMKVLAMIKI